MDISKMLETDLLQQVEFESEEQKENFLASSAELLWNRIMDRCYSLMNKEQVEEFGQFQTQAPSMIELIEKLSNYVPHIPEIIGEEAMDLKQDMLALTSS